MKRVIVATTLLLLTVPAGAGAGTQSPGPVCVVADSQPTCTMTAIRDGNPAYLVQGAVRISVKHGTTVTSACLNGVDAGNLRAPKFTSGDLITVQALVPNTLALVGQFPGEVPLRGEVGIDTGSGTICTACYPCQQTSR